VVLEEGKGVTLPTGKVEEVSGEGDVLKVKRVFPVRGAVFVTNIAKSTLGVAAPGGNGAVLCKDDTVFCDGGEGSSKVHR
jgi:hypothetical protein